MNASIRFCSSTMSTTGRFSANLRMPAVAMSAWGA
jgi:hypothetical protein